MSNRKVFVFYLILFFASLSLIPKFSDADPLDHWHLRNPLPTSNLLCGVTYGNGIFVAVGDLGTIVTSPDGESWTIRNSGTSDHLRGIGFGNNIFVAVGFNGTILTSPNGVTWTKRNSNTREILHSVTYGSGMFVAVGESSILTSQSGENWTIRARISLLSEVTHGNGSFVAVGYDDRTWDAVIYTSPDGIRWTKKIPGTVEPLYGVAYGNGNFVAVGFSGTIFTSPNGEAWTERDPQVGNNLYAIAYVNSIFAVAGWGIIMTSVDGIIWENSASLGQDILYGITYGNGTFVAVGAYGAIYTSSDAVTWINRKVEDFPFYSKIIYVNGMYVVLGNYDIVTTSDFKTWSVRYPDNLKKDMAYGNGTFVAVGKYGRLLTSHDGILWTESDALKKMGINYNLLVTFGQGIFVALEQDEAGNCKMLTSQDGENWTIKYTFWIDIGICSLNYEDGIFVLWASNLKPSGWTNAILISFDAEGWTKIVPETQIEMEGLTYGNGIFATVDRFGAIWTSPDGKTWAKMNNIPGWIGGIGFGGGYFVAGGYNNSYEKSLIVSSTDGVNWTARYLGLNSWLTGTPIYVNSTFIVSDSYGTGDQLVLQSDPISPEVISTPNILSGPTGGLEKVSYPFSTGGSYSNLDHPVQYLFDWGDGTNSGWLSVGTTSASKSWTSAGTYNVKTQARCASHTSVFSPWSEALLITIYPSPSPPANIQASDGTHMDKVEVSWTASLGTTSYTVYRATSSSKRARKTALGSTSETFFNDTTAVPKTTYYYCVKASNPYSTSDLSSYDAGYRSDGSPPIPTDVSASDGAYTDRVRISWTASTGATSYTVYRATSTSRRATKVVMGTATDPTYDDTTASAGVTYYYYVKASNSYGESGFSAYDTGYR